MNVQPETAASPLFTRVHEVSVSDVDDEKGSPTTIVSIDPRAAGGLSTTLFISAETGCVVVTGGSPSIRVPPLTRGST